MHWLGDRLRNLRDEYEDVLHAATSQKPAPSWEREAFLVALGGLVRDVAAHAGVIGAFAEYEGLVVDVAGAEEGAEALAAAASRMVQEGREAAGMVQLGDLQQLLLVGESRKVALIVLGPMSVGVVASSDVRLGRVLAR
jgi:predicted regulator of Ras-like GTPase activity (Roadblock/LC7/MglB family)